MEVASPQYWESCTVEGFGEGRAVRIDLLAEPLVSESDDFKDFFCAHFQALPDGVLGNPITLGTLEGMARQYEDGVIDQYEMPAIWQQLFPGAEFDFDSVAFFQR